MNNVYAELRDYKSAKQLYVQYVAVNYINGDFCVRFYHCTAYTVYFHCLHVCLLRVTLNINQVL